MLIRIVGLALFIIGMAAGQSTVAISVAGETLGIMLTRLNANSATQNSTSQATQQAANLALANAGVQ